MCLSSRSSAPAPAPHPAGAGFTVADVTTDTSKYTKVYDENQRDVTSEVVNVGDNKYRKKTASYDSSSSPDLQQNWG